MAFFKNVFQKNDIFQDSSTPPPNKKLINDLPQGHKSV